MCMRKIPNIVQTGAGAHSASYPVRTGDTFSRVKRPGREAHLRLMSKVSAWSCISTPSRVLHLLI